MSEAFATIERIDLGQEVVSGALEVSFNHYSPSIQHGLLHHVPPNGVRSSEHGSASALMG